MNKLFIIPTVFSFFFCCQSTSSSRDCSNFKEGNFKFSYRIDGVDKIGFFKRTQHYNIDYYEGKVDSSSVKWINDCEFILKKLKPKNLQEKDPIHMKIIETTDSSYVFEYKLVFKKLSKTPVVKRGVAYKATIN